jgi:hypothetical protein
VTNPMLLRRLFRLAGSCWLFTAAVAARATLPGIVVTNDLVLESGAQLPTRLIVRASHVTIDGAGATCSATAPTVSGTPFPCPPAKSRRGAESFAVKVIQNFLFHLARGQYVSPRFFFALASEKSQVMPDLEQHLLGLTLDLFEQYFLRAHVRNVSRLCAPDKSGVACKTSALLCVKEPEVDFTVMLRPVTGGVRRQSGLPGPAFNRSLGEQRPPGPLA